MRLSSAAANFFVAVAILVFGLVNSVLMARWLGPSARGEVAAALLWPSLLPYIGGTGMIDSLVFFAARPNADTRQIFGASMAFASILSLLLIAGGTLLMPLLLMNQPSEVVRVSQWLLLTIPLTLIGEFVSSLLRARMMIWQFNLQRLIVPIGYLVATIALFASESLSLKNIALVQVCLYCVRLLGSLLLCRWAQIGLGLSTDRALTRQMLAFAGRSHIGAVSEQVNSRIDQAFIAAWLPPAQLGLYVAAASTTSLLRTFSQALKVTILPQLAREDNPERQDWLLARNFRAYWTLALVSTPFVAIAIYWVLPIIYGDEFSAAVFPAIILVIGSLVFGAKDILSTSAKAIGLPWLGSKSEMAAVLATVVLLAVSLPTIGILGAAVTSVVAYTLALAMMCRGLSLARNIPSLTLFSLDRRLLNVKSWAFQRSAAG